MATDDSYDDKAEGRIMAMAGLYDVWKGPYSEPLLTYTIITTEPRPGIRSLHEYACDPFEGR